MSNGLIVSRPSSSRVPRRIARCCHLVNLMVSSQAILRLFVKCRDDNYDRYVTNKQSYVVTKTGD